MGTETREKGAISMKHRLRTKLTYSNVIATIALFVALGGAATAATQLPRNSVGTNQIKRGAVTTAKLRNQAVRPKKIAAKAVTVGKLGPQAVLPGNIANGGVQTNKLANQAVNASKIRNNVVTTNKLNNNAVTNQKLAPEAVGTANLQNGSVTIGKLAENVTPLVGTLKSGQTLRGVFLIGADGLNEVRASQSYQFPLLSTPTANVLKEGETSAACPGIGGGLGQTPEAAAGQLCVYITGSSAKFLGLTVVGSASNRLGFGLQAGFEIAEKEDYVQGQWAVTAP
jgi:hypothetical protein